MSNSQETEEPEIHLPKKLRQFYEMLRGGGDVKIVDLYVALSEKPPLPDSARMHMWLGPYVVKINRRIKKHGQAVRPGELRRTYRLIVL